MGRPVDPIIAELVRARREQGLTGRQVAARIGVVQSQLSYWETGARRPLAQNLADWAQALGYELTLRPLSTPLSPVARGLTCTDPVSIP